MNHPSVPLDNENNTPLSLIIDPADLFAPESEHEIFSWVVQINKINHEKILPKLEMYKYKNELEGFLIQEHMSMSRQLRVTSTILENVVTLKLDIIDCCLIVASQVRSIIENMAVVNFLIYDNVFSKEDKIQEIHNFRNQAYEWYKNKKVSSKLKQHELYTEFIRHNYKSINKNLWANISPQNDTLTKLIKNFKVTNNKCKISGDTLYQHWDFLSKLLHNNQLFRLFYWRKDNNVIAPNKDAYQADLNSALMIMANLFLESSLYDTIKIIGDDALSNLYADCTGPEKPDKL